MARYIDPSLSDLVLKPKSKKIARPPNAFMIFAREHRKSFAARHPDQNNKTISRMLGDAWKKVDFQTRQKYFGKAKDLEVLHKKQYPDYSYSPRIARMEKLKRSMRRARLRNDSEEEEEKIERKPRTPRVNIVQGKQEKKEETCIPESVKKSPTSEYVPNNPDYFKTSDEVVEKLSFPAQSETSCVSSSTSLCSGFDLQCPDYMYGSPSKCDCANCEKYWRERSPPPLLDPYRSPYATGYSGSPEPDGFASFPPPNYSFFHKPSIRTQYCPPNLQHPSYSMHDFGNVSQPYYGSLPWQQPLPWRPPLETNQCHYQNLDYYPRRDLGMNYFNPNLPYHYPYLDYPCDINWRESNRVLRSDFRHPSEAMRIDATSCLHSGHDSVTRSNDSNHESAMRVNVIGQDGGIRTDNYNRAKESRLNDFDQEDGLRTHGLEHVNGLRTNDLEHEKSLQANDLKTFPSGSSTFNSRKYAMDVNVDGSFGSEKLNDSFYEP